MLTKKSMKFLRRIIIFGGTIGSIPYRWNKTLGRVEYKQSSAWKLLWLFHNVVYVSYQVFVLFRWLEQLHAGAGMTSPRVMGTLYICFSYSLVPIVQYAIWQNYGQHHIWINGFIEYVADFRDRYAQKRSKLNQKSEVSDDWLIAAKLITAVFALVFVLDSLSVIAGPDEPYFLTSLLQEPKSADLLTILMILPIHLFIWIHQQATLLFFMIACLGYFACVQYVLQNMKCSVKGGSPDSPSKAAVVDSDSRIFASEYRKLQNLHGFYNFLWGGVNVGWGVACIGGSVLGFVGAVRFGGTRAVHQLVVGLLISGQLIDQFSKMGSINEKCEELLRTWQVQTRSIWFKRYLKSARTVRVTIGSFFYADRGIKLTILAIILNNSLSLLISSSSD